MKSMARMAGSARQKLWEGSADSVCMLSRIDSEELQRVKLRANKAKPRCAHSVTGRGDTGPGLERPGTERTASTRAGLRRDSVEPVCKKSDRSRLMPKRAWLLVNTIGPA